MQGLKISEVFAINKTMWKAITACKIVHRMNVLQLL